MASDSYILLVMCHITNILIEKREFTLNDTFEITYTICIYINFPKIYKVYLCNIQNSLKNAKNTAGH